MTDWTEPIPTARPVRPRLYGLRLSPGRAAFQAPVVLLVFALAPAVFMWPSLGQRLEQAGIWGMVLFNATVVLLALGTVQGAAAGGWQSVGISWRGVWRECLIGLALVIPCYLLAALSGLVAVGLASLFDGATIEKTAESRIGMLEVFGDISPWSIVPAAIVIGITEELLFRGFLLGRLMVFLRSPLLAVPVCAVVFGLFHLPMQGFLGLVQTTLAGLWLGAIAYRRNSIWAAAICHAGVDVIGLTLASILVRYIPELTGQAG